RKKFQGCRGARHPRWLEADRLLLVARGHLGLLVRELSATAAARHTALAAGLARLVGAPFVGRALGVGGAAPLAGNLALLVRGHRRESSAFLTWLLVHGVTSCAKAEARHMPHQELRA